MKTAKPLQISSLLLFSALWMAAPGTSEETPLGIVCDSNAYALCSHAECLCLDAKGNPAECEPHDSNENADRNVGWAKCSCPVITTEPEGGLLYRANYGVATDCAERQNPSKTGLFPSYAESEATVADVYSEYSFGDALDGDAYGTLSGQEVLLCRDQTLMTLCLDMPCTLDDSGTATCYCQNVTIDDPPGTFVTFGGDCKTTHCDSESKALIWSAALVSQILVGSDALSTYIRQHGYPDFKKPVKFCAGDAPK